MAIEPRSNPRNRTSTPTPPRHAAPAKPLLLRPMPVFAAGLLCGALLLYWAQSLYAPAAPPALADVEPAPAVPTASVADEPAVTEPRFEYQFDGVLKETEVPIPESAASAAAQARQLQPAVPPPADRPLEPAPDEENSPPVADLAAQPPVRGTAPLPAGDAARMTLQVGSFRSPQDADRLRQRVATIVPQPVSIQRVVVDNLVWHRVVIGPFNDQTSLVTAKARLGQQRISVIAVPNT